ncbi:hypothetical protein ACWD25_34535 [Streptomyces sp. NPDC002920]
MGSLRCRTRRRLAASFAVRPMLCELFSAQVGVLEHNISVEVATRYKEGARESRLGFAELLRHLFPELDQRRSEQGASLIIVLIGGLWTYTHPAPAVRAVYDADPGFAFKDSNFPDALHQMLHVLLARLLTRSYCLVPLLVGIAGWLRVLGAGAGSWC